MKSVIQIQAKGKSDTFALMSDIHIDNPKCRRDLLKKHLDEAIEKDATIFFNGDFFCAMQGNKDRRGSKSDIRPEHKVANYFDAIIQDAVEFLKPYAKNIGFFGYGNHETAILKHNEIDLLANLAYRLNQETGSNIELGGYGGWVSIRFERQTTRASLSFKIKYFHGSGGGGPVTKGVIQNNRLATIIHGADLIWQGHTHDAYHHTDVVEYMNVKYATTAQMVRHKLLHHVRTPSYKDEYADGTKGWHIERGGQPKPIGYYLLKLDYTLADGPQNRMEIVPTITPRIVASL